MLNQLVLPRFPRRSPRAPRYAPVRSTVYLRLRAEEAVLALALLLTRAQELGEGDLRPNLAGHEDVQAVLLAERAVVSVCRCRM
eukprot:5213762-Alexandrium_andersonii.AAC.1